MARIPTQGVAIYSPIGTPRQLTRVAILMAREFDREIVCTEIERKEIWLLLGSVIGLASQEAERPIASDVAQTLRSTVAAVEKIQTLLQLSRIGLVDLSPEEHAAAGAVIELLALDREVGSLDQAHAFIRDFDERCTAFAHACEVAAQELDALKGTAGRPALDWYNQLTDLLASLCEKYGLSPKLSRESNQTPSGPLCRLAELMEEFLPKNLCSPSDEARFSRLKTGLKARRQSPRKKKYLGQ